MLLLPVLDLAAGQVVHARGGHRPDYLPLQSIWSDHAGDPVALASALRDRVACQSFYVADLDALSGQNPQFQVLQQLQNARHQLWLDAAIHSAQQAKKWRLFGINRLIIATESLPSLTHLREIISAVDPRRLVLSVDLWNDQLRIPFTIDRFDLIQAAWNLGIRAFLILDIARVGKNEGPANLDLLRRLRDNFPEMQLITGGGVRDGADLDRLAQAGVSLTLIATALHDGRLNQADWTRYPFA